MLFMHNAGLKSIVLIKPSMVSNPNLRPFPLETESQKNLDPILAKPYS